jgi:PhnB protein
MSRQNAASHRLGGQLVSYSTTTHLNFRGTARQALEFYGSVFGGHVHVVTYGEFGMPAELPDASKVVFGAVQNGSGLRLLAYDIPGTDGTDDQTAGSTRRENGTTVTDRTFFQALGADTIEEATALWEALADGADIVEPFAASQWSAGFGMLTDRFGVTWIVQVETPQS